MIVGAGGGVGIHAVQIARLCGGRVIAVDTSEEKLAKTKEVGADATINASRLDYVEESKKLTRGEGVDAILDLVCTSDTLSKDYRSLNRGGRLVCMASGRSDPGGATLAVTPGSIVSSEFVVTGSRYCTKQEFIETMEMVKEGRIKPVITQTFSLEEVPKAHDLLDQAKITGRAVMIM
jgi:propanol-preferring alcohol dehydrogenase